MKWVERNSTQLGSVSKETICVLPLGATEQHGPQLPVGTDQFIADGIAERLDAAYGSKLLVLRVWGKPSLASAEKCQATLEIVVRTIKEFLRAQWPDAPDRQTCRNEANGKHDRDVQPVPLTMAKGGSR
jgi:creatinine amidohydrolase/Fe(II)-dependent formamide hydrolase-like protein